MKKTVKLITISLAVSALLVGCGGSTSSDTTNNVSSSDDLTGYFIDAEVAGVGYETTSGLKGTTDGHGAFKYKSGDKVKLHIGNLTLGEVEPQNDGLVTPQTLSHGDDDIKELLLRTLQSLDSDNNTTNGITIPEDITSSLHTIDTIDMADIKTEEELLKVHTHLSLAIDKDFDGHIDVESKDAHEHFADSMSSWEHGDKHEDTTIAHGNKPENAGEHDNSTTENSEDCNNTLDINTMALSTLTTQLKDAISYMGNEERLAYDIYTNLYNYHLNNSGISIEQLKNIAQNAEIKHIEIVQNIVKKYTLTSDDLSNVSNPVANSSVAIANMPSGEYGIESIQTLYNAIYEKGVTSQKDALEVGCMVEVTDINDLDKYIVMAQDSKAQDVIDSFNILRDGSYSHYWAFDKGLKDIGVTDGCCSLGSDYCHNEYPTHEHDETTQTVENSDTHQEQQKGKGKH